MTASRKALIIVGVLLAVAFGLPWGGLVAPASAQVKVDDAVPGSAPQGTLGLDVKILGSGFQRRGTTAKFYVTGTTNPGGIKVNSTRYVDTATLVANIDIAPDAAALGFDIEVLSGGRTGKGTDLFSVTERMSDELTAEFQDSAQDRFRSDGMGTYSWAPNFTGGQVIFNHQYGFIDFQAYLSSSARTVTLEFDTLNNVRNAVENGLIACRQFDGTPFPAPEAAPGWAPGVPRVSYFAVRTEKLAVPPQVGGAGVWTFSGSPFNVRDMTVGDTRVVGILLSFKDEAGRQFSVRMNQDAWLSTDLQYVSGFAKVTRESRYTWVLQQLGVDDPRPVGVANQGNLRLYAPEVKRVHAAGTCDVGDWLMPFRITFTSVQ